MTFGSLEFRIADETVHVYALAVNEAIAQQILQFR